MFHFLFFFILINTLQSTKYTVIYFGTLGFFLFFCWFFLFFFFHTVHKSQLFSIRPAKKTSVCTRWESKASTSQLHTLCPECNPQLLPPLPCGVTSPLTQRPREGHQRFRCPLCAVPLSSGELLLPAPTERSRLCPQEQTSHGRSPEQGVQHGPLHRVGPPQSICISLVIKGKKDMLFFFSPPKGKSSMER